jgi:predicted regulator of Ras-like GTPase activity (Roadblock/LC7/MglB family)
MDAHAALDKLTEVSRQVEAAVIVESGEPLASTVDSERAARFGELATRILSTVDELEGDTPVLQVEAATGEGSVFLVREGDTFIAATTAPTPVMGLVMYDLRTCLRALTPEREPA